MAEDAKDKDAKSLSLAMFARTSEMVKKKAAEFDSVLVGFSGGKESLVTLDLCWRAFRHTVAFHMFFVPGLRFIEEQMNKARERYPGLQVVYYPSKNLIAAMCEGAYRPSHFTYDDLPEVKSDDIYEWARTETGIQLIALGMRKADTLSRRRIMARMEGKVKNRLHPLADWTKWDVLAYLGINNIPIPPSYGGATTDVGLAAPAILWLHDCYPDDYEKLRAYFPYISAVLKRREWYGRGDYYTFSGPVKKRSVAEPVEEPKEDDA